MTTTFNDLGLRPELVRAVTDMGFEIPTPIQAQAIPALINSRHDLVGLAQTGTGKTAAFCLPVLHQIDSNLPYTQALILCPTRELCLQISKEVESFTKHLPALRSVAVYGGDSIERQIRELNRGAHLVVGTPGRVCDLIRRSKLTLDDIHWLVLDEADEMLSMGFKDELDEIIGTTPNNRQTLLFSATMEKGVADISRSYMKSPKEISVGKRNQGAENVEHHYYVVRAKDRYEALKRVLTMTTDCFGIIFCRTRRETQEIADWLNEDGHRTEALHGDMSQAQREQVMARFRRRITRLLVATDVAARGIDVEDLTHVINYNLPDMTESYIHRSGRTGRAGKQGIAITIVHSKEISRIKEVERKLGRTMERKQIPVAEEMYQYEVNSLVEKIKSVEVDATQIRPLLPQALKGLEGLDYENLLTRIITLELTDTFAKYRDSEDINAPAESKKRDGRTGILSSPDDKAAKHGILKERRQLGNTDFERLQINLGGKDGINPRRLLEIVNEGTGIRDIEIGKIEIDRHFTVFDVEKSFAAKVVSELRGARYKGKAVIVKPDRGEEAETPQSSRPSFKERDRAPRTFAKRSSKKSSDQRDEKW